MVNFSNFCDGIQLLEMHLIFQLWPCRGRKGGQPKRERVKQSSVPETFVAVAKSPPPAPLLPSNDSLNQSQRHGTGNTLVLLVVQLVVLQSLCHTVCLLPSFELAPHLHLDHPSLLM